MPGDITDEEKIQAIIKDIYEKEGRIDILVNNAGMGISGSIEGQTQRCENIFNVNFVGAFITIKQFYPT